MTDKAYIISRTLENKIAIAENNDQNTLLVALDVLKEILALLKEQDAVKIEVKKINGSGRCGRCPNCLIELNEMDYPYYCGYCGKAVKWK